MDFVVLNLHILAFDEVKKKRKKGKISKELTIYQALAEQATSANIFCKSAASLC